jgi:hypothetical protein
MQHEWKANRKVYNILMGNPEGNGPLVRTRNRWKSDSETSLRREGWGGVDWMDVAQHMDQGRAVLCTKWTILCDS